jgi:hypothetical protein
LRIISETPAAESDCQARNFAKSACLPLPNSQDEVESEPVEAVEDHMLASVDELTSLACSSFHH